MGVCLDERCVCVCVWMRGVCVSLLWGICHMLLENVSKKLFNICFELTQMSNN